MKTRRNIRSTVGAISLARAPGFAALVLLVGGGAVPAQNRDVARLYAEHCASCHGADLRGGQTDSLLDDVWRHGTGDDETLFRVIRDGDELNGMPAMGGALSDAEIRAMVIFIREKATHAREQRTEFARPSEGQVVSSRLHRFRLTTVVDGLATPWSVAWLPDGRMLVAELPGTLRVVERGRLLPEPVAHTPRVRYKGQGGLMEVKPHPGYATNGWIYLAYSEAGTNAETRDGGMTVVVRGRLREHRWTDEQTIFRPPLWTYRPGGIHFGCRLVFDDAGHLFFPIGERGHMQDAQDLSRPNGKVHRVRDDGRVPPDNPFVGRTNAMASIWSYGHRNPQGLDRHPVTGELWSTEHGPRGGDELNLVLPGRNYGWPIITYGMNYNGTPITALTARAGLEQPVVHWTPSIAVCAAHFYRGDRFPRWKHHLFVTGLAAEELRRLEIRDHRVIEQEVVFKNVGRVRDVATGPDGLLYIVLNKPDKVVRLEPVGD